MSIKKLTINDVLHLPNSPVKIPRLGFGVYKATGDVCASATLAALKHGYRHIDSAELYSNEREVGEAVHKSHIPRQKVFITTKIMQATGSPAATYQTCVDSVWKIDEGGYVDLFLIHTPSGGKAHRKEAWLALEQLVDEGKVRSIGVSNYGIQHIEEMKNYAKIWPPHVNQIELHPWCQQREIVDYCMNNGIIVEAYCPLVRNQKAKDPTLVALAKKYSVTTAQILIRYSLQKGWVPLPKSEHPERIAENADVFGFEITELDMEKLDALDEGADGAIVEAVKN
ncbi:MAG: hypothetical protein M1834_006147 [Cirrosporium novae-zelandiae]|nr:MAG: hypothetical protein M1834_006147 [Cirrosporium novae-zelandiae]